METSGWTSDSHCSPDQEGRPGHVEEGLLLTCAGVLGDTAHSLDSVTWRWGRQWSRNVLVSRTEVFANRGCT